MHRDRIGAPQLAQNPAPAGLMLPQFAQVPMDA
jgi:hypothetical protein